jgi:ATP-dependent Clp protease protease subunit
MDETNGFFKPELKEVWITDITEESAVLFHERLMQEFEKDPYKPIIININSYGGEVDALFSMLDTMDSIRSMAPEEFKFITVTTGKAQSAGAALLSYGDVRMCTPNARIMIHQVIGGNWGSQPSNEVEHEEMTRMNARLLQILRSRCKLKMSIDDFKQKLSHNLYLTPEKAKQFGIIDIIGYPKLIEQTVYEVRVVNGELPKEKPNANRRTNQKSSKN